MPTVDELVEKYKSYSDEDLYKVYADIESYSAEAKEALNISIQHKGGLAEIQERLKQKYHIAQETERLRKEINWMISSDGSYSLQSSKFHSDLISQEQIARMIEDQTRDAEAHREDVKVKPRTYWGSIIGGLIGGTLGGIV